MDMQGSARQTSNMPAELEMVQSKINSIKHHQIAMQMIKTTSQIDQVNFAMNMLQDHNTRPVIHLVIPMQQTMEANLLQSHAKDYKPQTSNICSQPCKSEAG